MAETESSTMLNVRIDAGAHRTMQGLAKELDVSLTAVVRPFIMWASKPAGERAQWLTAVADLRKLVADAGIEDTVYLKELTDKEFFEHRDMCDKLREIGFIDDFKSVRAQRDGYRLCTYKLTETGRIVASVFQEAVEEAPEEMQLNFSEEAQERAS